MMHRGLGIIVDPGMCNTFGIFCGEGTAMMGVPAPTQPAVPAGGYQPGLLTGDPQSIINSTIDPSAAQDRLNLSNFFGGVNAMNQAGESSMTASTLALLAIGGIALLAFFKR